MTKQTGWTVLDENGQIVSDWQSIVCRSAKVSYNNRNGTATRKQTGWLVRDPKGRVVGTIAVYHHKRHAIFYAWHQTASTDARTSRAWWSQAQKNGYTVEKVAL